MFEPRSLESIQQLYFAALAEVGSGVLDVSQGSLAYTLSRGNSALAAEQDVRLKALGESSYLDSSSGSSLDRWASSVGLKRLGAAPSSGYVLAISSKGDVIITSDTILTDLKSGVQLAINQRGSVTVHDYVETAIPVRSTRLGASTLLGAGTELYSPKYPGVSFTVAFSRSVSGEYCGSLTGGRDRESDWDFKKRVSTALTTYGSCSAPKLRMLLEAHPLVSKAYVSTRVAGVVELWVDSLNTLSQSQLDELQRYISPYAAAGTLVSMGVINRRYVDVQIYAQPFVSSDLDSLTDQMSSAVKYIFDTLAIGEPLSLNVLSSAVAPLARSARVVTPTADVIPQPYELVSYRAIDLTYATQS